MTPIIKILILIQGQTVTFFLFCFRVMLNNSFLNCWSHLIINQIEPAGSKKRTDKTEETFSISVYVADVTLMA